MVRLGPLAALGCALLACGAVDESPAVDAAPTVAPDRGAADARLDAAVADARPDARPVDAAADRALPPPLPRAIGPDPGLFDCTADFVDPGRRSPVPLDCVIDPDCDQPMVVGHRGAGGQLGTIAPENSRAAIRAALLMGLDGIELDVRHTADDKLVVLHDATVDRTAFGSGAADDFTQAELAAMPLRPFVRDDIPGDFACETIPTLEEAFALTRGRLFIDLDTKTSRVDLVVQAIREAGVIDEVFVSVSGVDRAVRARELDPDIRIQIRPDSPEEYAEAMALFADGRPPEVIEIPGHRIAEMAPPIRAAGLAVFTNVFGDDAVALLRDRVEVYRERYAEGAHILQTEYPPLVLRALERVSDM